MLRRIRRSPTSTTTASPASPLMRRASEARRRPTTTRRRRTTGSSFPRRDDWRRSARKSYCPARQRLPQAIDPPALSPPRTSSDVPAPADASSWAPDAWREALPPAGRERAHVRIAAGRRHDGLDRIHRPEDVSAAKTLYWRVQALDENPTNTGGAYVVGDSGTFEIELAKPTLDPATPTLGDSSLPVLSWFPVAGAVSYSLRIHEPNDTTPNTYSGFRPRRLPSEDHRHRNLLVGDTSRFPESARVPRPAPGPIPPTYTHTIKEPTNPVSSAGANRLVMSWDAKTGTKQYRVQVSKREDFSPGHRAEDDRQSRLRAPAHLVVLQRGRHFLLARRRDRRRRERGHLRQQPGPFHTPHGFGRRNRAEALQGHLHGPSRQEPDKRHRRQGPRCHDSERRCRAPSCWPAAPACPPPLRTTNSSGVAKFRLRPTKLKKITFRITKAGYVTAYIKRKVHTP